MGREVGACSPLSAGCSAGAVSAASKPFPGCDTAARASSPRFPQLGLQSDFWAGFLLFHITTIIKMPAMRESTDSARELPITGAFKTQCSDKKNLSRANEKQFRHLITARVTKTHALRACARPSCGKSHRECVTSLTCSLTPQQLSS